MNELINSPGLKLTFPEGLPESFHGNRIIGSGGGGGGGRIDDDRGSGDDGPMDARVTALEKDMKEVRERLIKIEAKVDELPKIFATKADLHEALHSLTWKLAGMIGALAAATYFIAKNVH